jgi:phosphoglycolate phosphatase-like HAD superfamily hydrolase
MDGPNDNILLLNPLQPCEVRVVTFDLDNTLWKTGPTIAMANDALAGFLIQKGIACPVRVEKVMNELFLATPSIYTPLDCKAPLSPVLLTNLRKDAIRSVLETHNSNLTDSAVTALVDEAFGVWTRTRHESIAQHLAVSAAACLQRIREMTTSQGKTVVIGAITDGNSDPKAVAALQEYFDFCVNAERVGVSKPDKRMYLEAMRQVASQPVLGDLFQNLKSGQTHEEENETLENAMVCTSIIAPFFTTPSHFLQCNCIRALGGST